MTSAPTEIERLVAAVRNDRAVQRFGIMSEATTVAYVRAVLEAMLPNAPITSDKLEDWLHDE